MGTQGFHPTIQRWFAQTLGEPTPPQREGWPRIAAGENTLIAAPTGSGKTLAAFLCALDGLLRQGDALPDETQVVYVSPLKALGNDVQKNLQSPLEALRALDPTLPDVRVMVRSGDTPSSERTKMLRKPPHILVTTPESLYILLTSEGGKAMLRTARTVIVDEIHALAPNRRGTHLTLTLERLVALCGENGADEPQRIGLSATQKPIAEIAQFLCGPGRECSIVDTGHLRELDLALEVPPSPLSAICSTETWAEVYARMVELIGAHRTTLVFTNTRKMAERVAARLTEVLGKAVVTSHHGSLSKQRRLDAEQRLKRGELKALVATASLELGIDVGDVDLVIQTGSVPRIATFLQRVGRAGHGVNRLPKGRIFPLTIDELVAAAALLRSVRAGELDRICVPRAPLDVLTQQIVAACVQQDWDEDALYRTFKRAWPYRDLAREDFDAAVRLHADGSRLALLHEDGVNARLRATKRARLPALTSGGTIQAVADYQVVIEPDGTRVGSVDEDFAIEASVGDVFQLGNASWQVLKVEPGKMRVRDAKGAPPSLPFWFGEAPARSAELSESVNAVREHGEDEAFLRELPDIPDAAREQIRDYLREGREALGCIPTRKRIVLERFFDESGGMQVVLHAPFGARINKALGLALRKRFCRGFGFELQAAANEEAIVFSLGPMHSFPLSDVFSYLRPETARDVLVQALLPAPLFQTRWRWNVNTSLVVPRTQTGRLVPTPILRMRAEDALARAFPQVVACGETLPPGDLQVPYEHPLVRQAIADCLEEAMDVDGMLDVLRDLRSGAIEGVAVDTPNPSVFCQSILNAAPYAFLDDAPLEERRTQAVQRRSVLDQKTVDEIGALDPEAVARVRAEAWPEPQSADEVHEALLWMGFLTDGEAHAWREWLAELAAAGRVERVGDRWFATESGREPLDALRGRLEALGPVFADTLGLDAPPLLVQLEAEGAVLRVRLDGREAWCNRRLLARVHRYTLDRLRKEIRPVTAATFLRFLGVWQRSAAGSHADGPRGLCDVLEQLAGLEVPAHAWESAVLPLRVERFQRDWLDQLTLSGEFAWGRLWGRGGAITVRNTPLCVVPRKDLATWLALAPEPEIDELGAPARELFELLQRHGAMFPTDLESQANLLPSYFENGLAELVARGLATCDSFAAIRQLIVAPGRRRRGELPFGVGRWSLLERADASSAEPDREAAAEFAFDRLLARYGVVFHKLLLREKLTVTWRELLRVGRAKELRGDVRGGRFVEGFSGEQFALPEAIRTLRRVRRDHGAAEPLEVTAADPLNLRGILTPDPRVSPLTRQTVAVG